MRSSGFLWATVLTCGALAAPAFGQEPPAPQAAAAVLPGGLVLGGLIDGYYGFNANRPDGPAKLRNFDTRHNEFSLNLAEVVLERRPASAAGAARFGFRMDLDVGPTADLVAAAEPAGAGRYAGLQQGYVSVLAPIGRGLQVDVGKMVTPLGAEVIESPDNWNYSRSLLFTLAIPYYHMGARASYAVSDRLGVSGWIVNGWNNVQDNNHAKTFVAQASVRPWPKLAIVHNVIRGAEQADHPRVRRTVFDTVAVLQAARRLTLMVNHDWGHEGANGQRARWQGLALYARWRPAASWALSPRVEWYEDPQGLTTGQAQVLRELTITSEHRFTEQLAARVEYRGDRATQASFRRAAGDASAQHTLTVGFFYVFTTARP
jgi:hypothetical protein